MKPPEFECESCRPGEVTIMHWMCETPFRATRLIIETFVGFEVYEFKIGNTQQFAPQPIAVSARIFAPDAEEPGFQFETAFPGEGFELRVKNVSTGHRPFVARLEGKYGPFAVGPYR